MASKITVLPSINVNANWQRLTTSSMNTFGQKVFINCSGGVYFNTTNNDAGRTYLTTGNYDLSGADPATLWFQQVSAGPAVGGYVITE